MNTGISSSPTKQTNKRRNNTKPEPKKHKHYWSVQDVWGAQARYVCLFVCLFLERKKSCLHGSFFYMIFRLFDNEKKKENIAIIEWMDDKQFFLLLSSRIFWPLAFVFRMWIFFFFADFLLMVEQHA